MGTRRLARSGLRLVRTGLHLIAAAGIAGLVFPRVPEARRLALQRQWCRALLDILGLRLAVDGAVAPGGVLLVANHVSWVDVIALNAVSPASFVSKDDVVRWPLIGWLLPRTDTLLLRRNRPRDAQRIGAAIADRLAAGRRIVLFPEGTTTDGNQVLPFSAALLEAAVAQRAPVQPIAIAYLERDGTASRAPVYAGDTSFLQSLLTIVEADALTARVRFLPPLSSVGRSRRALARCARAEVLAALTLA
jgi:1-acyl-sn-glycerol-3-phosphate acyltransferase